MGQSIDFDGWMTQSEELTWEAIGNLQEVSKAEEALTLAQNEWNRNYGETVLNLPEKAPDGSRWNDDKRVAYITGLYPATAANLTESKNAYSKAVLAGKIIAEKISGLNRMIRIAEVMFNSNPEMVVKLP